MISDFTEISCLQSKNYLTKHVLHVFLVIWRGFEMHTNFCLEAFFYLHVFKTFKTNVLSENLLAINLQELLHFSTSDVRVRATVGHRTHSDL